MERWTRIQAYYTVISSIIREFNCAGINLIAYRSRGCVLCRSAHKRRGAANESVENTRRHRSLSDRLPFAVLIFMYPLV